MGQKASIAYLKIFPMTYYTLVTYNVEKRTDFSLFIHGYVGSQTKFNSNLTQFVDAASVYAIGLQRPLVDELNRPKESHIE